MPSTDQLKDESTLWSIYDEAQQLVLQRQSKSGVRLFVLEKFAEEYGIEPSDINPRRNSSIYSSVSRVMRLLYPKRSQAERNLRKELARGNLGFNCAVEIARGNIASREEYISPGSSIIVAGQRGITLSALIASVVDLARTTGYSDEEIVSELIHAQEQLQEGAD